MPHAAWLRAAHVRPGRPAHAPVGRLGGRDSNPDSQDQNLVSCHWTTPQGARHILARQSPARRTTGEGVGGPPARVRGNVLVTRPSATSATMQRLLQGKNVRKHLHIVGVLAAMLSMLGLCTSAEGGAGTGKNPPAREASHARARARACSNASLMPTPTNTAAIDSATLCLIDRVRRADRLSPLRANRELQTVAVSQVREMVSLDYFSDVRPSGTTPGALIAGTPYGRHAGGLLIGENIGWATGTDATPAQMVTAWLESPPHRELILGPQFRDAGVGATAAAPALLAHGEAGATYALELARRH